MMLGHGGRRTIGGCATLIVLACVGAFLWKNEDGSGTRLKIPVPAHQNGGVVGEQNDTCTTGEGWPWKEGPPVLAMCSRKSEKASWTVLKPTQSFWSSLSRKNVCLPKTECSRHGLLHVRAWRLDPTEEVFGKQTQRDRGSMHDTVLSFQDNDGTWYIVKDTSSHKTSGMHAVQSAFGIGKLVDDCGFNGVVARPVIRDIVADVYTREGSFLEQVSIRNAHISDYREGVSLASIHHVASKSAEARAKARAFLRSVPGRDVLLAAAFDFLTVQFDRVSKNVLLDSNRSVHLIDNLDSSFGEYLGHVELEDKQVHSSVFLEPASSMYIGCYVQDASTESDYPPQLAQCLARLQNTSAENLYEEYQMPSLLAAQLLQQRAALLLGGMKVALANYLGPDHLHALDCM